ncbi:MAG TPA: FAD-dependent oxidoreductase [Candidatus Binatia bacterium]|jgi:ferredoxin-NADP reductase|nr:FAD-dependent oxidoreductase [Candidatus Binatia bacterium]
MAAPEIAARVERVVAHAPDTRSLFLRLPAGERLAFRPGQFISCLLPVGGERLTRPYSIASDPERGDLLEIVLNRVPGGAGSHYLLSLPEGAILHFTGPWGTFVLDRAPDAEAVFIADGTGVAPIRPMIHRALATGPRHPLTLVHAGARKEALLYRREMETLAREREEFAFEPLPPGVLVDEVRRRWVAEDGDRTRRFWICGVGDVVPRLRDLLRGAGYERRAVQYEKW